MSIFGLRRIGRGGPLLALPPTTPAASAGVPPAEYTFGTHQEAIYNAEALKGTYVRGAIFAGATAAIGTFISVPQQAYADIAPSFTRPSIAGHTPPIIPVQYAAPQIVDLTLPAQVSRSLVAGAKPSQSTFQFVPPQSVDLTLQASIQKALVSGVQSSQSTFQYAAPQIADLTQQAISTKPILGPTGSVPGYVSIVQQDTGQLAAVFTRPSVTPPVVTGPVPPYVFATPQIEDRPTDQTWPAVQIGGPPPALTPWYITFGSHAQVLYGAENIKSRTWPSAFSPPPVGAPVVGAFIVASPQYPYGPEGQQGFLRGAVRTPPAPPPVVCTYVYGAQAAYDYYMEAQIWAPAPNPQGWIIPYQEAEPQDTTQPAPQWSAPVNLQVLPTGKLGTFAFAQPQDPTQLAAQWSTPPIGVVLPTGKLGAFAYAAPQLIDLTLPATISEPVVGPSIPLVSKFSSPQIVDLTLPAQISASVIGPSIPLISKFSAPQVVDLTLAAQITPIAAPPPPIFGPTVHPQPAVPPQPDLNVNYSVAFTYVPTISPSAPAPTVLYRVGGPRTGDPGTHERDSTRVGTSTSSRNLQ